MIALIIIILIDLVMMYLVLRVGLKEDHHPVSLTAPSVQAMQARIPAPPAGKAAAPAEVIKDTATADTATSASTDADE